VWRYTGSCAVYQEKNGLRLLDAASRFHQSRLQSIIELPPVAGKITDDAYHAWGKQVRSLGQNVRQQLAKEPQSLPNDDAALQEKAANLIIMASVG
jgi:hypothetical protein